MTTKLLANQLRSILNEPVEGFTVELADESDMFEWKVWIEGPKDTPYAGGIFQLSLKFPKDYPMAPPELKFVSDFWHPNVFPTGKVCLSILHPPGEDAMSGELPEERWLPTQSVTTIILSLQSVLNDPNCASPANVDASVEWRNNREAYKARTRKLVDKANRECPSHVVIPHPESDPEQHKRRVQKFHEMNKDLDYDDFYENDAEEHAETETGDEEEFLASENEDINTDDEAQQSPQAQPREGVDVRKSSEEVVSESAEAAKKEKEETSSKSSSEEVKPTSKGKEKAPEDSSEEEILTQPSSSSATTTSPTPASAPAPAPAPTDAPTTDAPPVLPAPVSSSVSQPSSSTASASTPERSVTSNNNNNDVPPPIVGKKSKKGKGKKCIVM